jgi:RND superfamily putative drug exporter
LKAWADLVLRRRRLVVAVWAAALLVALPIASRLSDELSGGGYEVPGSESDRARSVIVDDFDGGERLQSLYVVSLGAPGQSPPRGWTERVEVALRTQPQLAAVGPAWVTAEGRTAVVPFAVTGSLDDAERMLPGLRDRLAGIPDAVITGQAAIFDASTQIAADDLTRAERISFPVTLAILLIAFLSVVAAGIPILLGLVSLIVTFGCLFLVAQLLETSVFATNTAILLGLGLSIDYSLFIVSRYRERRLAGVEVEEALRTTLATTGRAIAFSGLTVAVSLACLVVVGVPIFTSMALAATVAALVAGLGALSLLPALLHMLGPRLDRLMLRRAYQAAARARFWHWLAAAVLRHRVVLTVGVVAVLILAAIPIVGLRIGFPSTETLLPNVQSSPVAAAAARIDSAFGIGTTAPLEIVTPEPSRAVAAVAAADPGVRAVLATRRGEDGWAEIIAAGRAEDNSAAARDTLARLRAELHTRFPGTLVGGRTGEGEDLAARVSERFPLVILATSLVTLVLLLLAFRSIVIPLKAVLTNLLTVGATLGLLTVFFQWFEGADDIAHFVPLFLFAILFGLSMDYEVLLLSRIRDEHLAGAANEDAITNGLVKSARPITLAALIMVTVFAASATSGLEPFRQLGVGMSLAVLIDATLVRCLLIPAAMALLGRWNWWLPRRLAALFERGEAVA